MELFVGGSKESYVRGEQRAALEIPPWPVFLMHKNFARNFCWGLKPRPLGRNFWHKKTDGFLCRKQSFLAS